MIFHFIKVYIRTSFIAVHWSNLIFRKCFFFWWYFSQGELCYHSMFLTTLWHSASFVTNEAGCKTHYEMLLPSKFYDNFCFSGIVSWPGACSMLQILRNFYINLIDFKSFYRNPAGYLLKLSNQPISQSNKCYRNPEIR